MKHRRGSAFLRLATLALPLAGCATSGEAAQQAGTTPGSIAATPDAPDALELTVRDPRGGFVHVGDLRGQIVLIVVVSTYDTMSHAQIAELERFALHRPDVAFVGVLAQPRAEALAEPFVRALDPSFPLGFDPDGAVAEGTSGLGAIETVPTLVALDREGRVASRREGYQSERVLEAMVLTAASRAPERERSQPPLLGGARTATPEPQRTRVPESELDD